MAEQKFLTNLDVAGTIDLNNLTINSAQGTDGQVLTSTGTGIAWEDASGGSSNWTLSGNDIYNNNSGDVGINTANPSHKLDVNGTLGVTGLATFSNQIQVNDSGAQARLNLNNTGTGDPQINFQLGGTSSFTIGVDNSDSDKFKISGGSSLGSSDRITVDGLGNVGINTTSPDQKLDVAGNVTANRYYGNTNTNFYIDPNHTTTAAVLAGGLEIGYGGEGEYRIEVGEGRTGNGYAYIDFTGDTTYSDYGLRLIRNNTGANTSSQLIHRGTGILNFKNQEAAHMTFDTSNTERMRITSGGDIGIGTDNPDSMLHLKSTGDVKLILEADSDNSGENDNPLIELKQDNSGIIGRLGMVGDAGQLFTNSRTNSTGLGTVYQQDLIFFTENSARVYIKGESGYQGRVGIGTATPSHELHITGTGEASDDFRAPIFYDSSNTAYYVDPANTGRAAYLRGDIEIINEQPLLELNDYTATSQTNLNAWVSFQYNGTEGGYVGYGSDATDYLYLSNYSGRVSINGSFTEHANSSRAPIFYDTDNTSYYTNPAGRSNLSTLVIGSTSANTSGYALDLHDDVHMHNYNINYVNQLHFQDNVRFIDMGNDQYLKFKWGDTGSGGIQFYDGDDTRHGYIYGDGSGRFGFLDNDGHWAVRIQTGTSPLQLRCNNNNEFEVYDSYTLSVGSSRSPIFYDSDNTGYFMDLANSAVAIDMNGYIYQAKEDYDIDASRANAIYQATRSTQTDRGSWPGSYYYAVNFGDRTKGIQLAAPYSSANNLYFRSGTDNSSSENGANVWKNWRQLYHVDYHPEADKWTTARTLTLNGDVSGSVSWDGSANATLTTTVANDSHTHDGRYYTESESDTRFFRANAGNSVDVRINAAHGRGVRFWDSDSYKIYMSGTSQGSGVGGSVPGAATSDYNMYFKMTGGTNRGFVFKNSSTDIAQIDGNGHIHTAGHFYGRSVHGQYSNLYRMGGVYFTWDSDSYGTNFNHSITSSYGGTYGDDMTINSYHHLRINIDSNNNNSDEKFEIGNNTTGTGNVRFRVLGTGAVYAANDVVAFYSFSDKRLKTDIKPTTDNLEKILKLKPIEYRWKDGGRDGKKEIGLIAQEVEKIVPEVVRENNRLSDDDETLYKQVDYEHLVSTLIGAVQEQQKQINELKSIINGGS